MATHNRYLDLYTKVILAYSVIWLCYLTMVRGEIKAVSACFGVGSEPCYLMRLECPTGNRIHLLSQQYGVKDGSCDNKRNRCYNPNRNGCCAHSSNDCMEPYSVLHAYNLHRSCSGKQTCGPLQAPRHNLATCGGATSTYVYILYECVSEPVAQFCASNEANGPEVDILFTKADDIVSSVSDCSCFLSAASGDSLVINYADVRLEKGDNNRDGTACSSARLTSNPDVGVDTTCSSSVSEEVNFIFGKFVNTSLASVQLKLLDVYPKANNQPTNIWLKISGKQRRDVTVTCFIIVDGTGTTPLTPVVTSGGSTSTGRTDTTDVGGPPDEPGSNAGAIAAGILVPIIILVIVGVIVFCLYKRRGFGFLRKKQNTSKQNNYIEDNIDEEYAEIGFVPDVPNTTPTYDPVYIPGNRRPVASNNAVNLTYNGTGHNGHTYSNLGAAAKSPDKTYVKGSQAKEEKQSAFGRIKSHTGRLISFFKRQTERDFPPAKAREREPSAEPYDHLRPTSGVHVEIIPPPDSPKHVYNHTAIGTDAVDNVEVENTNTLNVEDKDSDKDSVNAIHVGDSYIEFQFGEVDKDKLVKPSPSQQDLSNMGRPEPPSRPPPSPKLGQTKDAPKIISNTKSAMQKTNSPNQLSPKIVIQTDEENYDYAEGNVTPNLSPSPRRLSNASEVSSEHSYKVLEPQQTYDYADCSDNEVHSVPEEYGAIYEDIEANGGRARSVRKYKSAAGVPEDTGEYLEPVQNRERTVSSPGVMQQNTPGYYNVKKNPGVSNPSAIATELNKKLQNIGEPNVKLKSPKFETKEFQPKQKPDDVPKQHSESDLKINGIKNTGKPTSDIKKPLKVVAKPSATANAPKPEQENLVIKSDNVDTKDYEKPGDVKGVLNMAKMFESRESSESESSRQSSPRNIITMPKRGVAASPKLKKNVSDSEA